MTVSKRKKRTRLNDYAPQSIHRAPSLLDRLAETSLTIAGNRIITSVMILLFVILSFLSFPGWGGGDYDMWWHLALGKHYLSQHTMRVNHALFSWTPADPDWIYNTWLGSTLVYLSYTAAGGFGLWLFQWGIFAGTFLIFLSFVRSTLGALDINGTSLLLMVVVAEGLALVFPKPDLFTPLFFSALILVFFSIKLGKLTPRYYYLYPPLFALWVNLHGGFIVGVATVALVFGIECVIHGVGKKGASSASGLIHLGCALVLICAACMLNPYGLAYPWDVITVTFPLGQQLTGEKSAYVSSLIAYLPLWPYLLQPGKLNWFAASWVMVLLLGMFFAVSVAAFRKERFAEPSLLLLNPILFLFGITNVRACIFFPTVAFFSILYTLKMAGLIPMVKRFTLVSVLLFLLLGSTVVIKLTETSTFNYFGTRLDETVPVEEVELIKKHRLPAPLFNDYVSGGYMIWAMYPDYQVFIDSRGKPYELTRLWDQYDQLMGKPSKENIQALRSRYPFRVALINLLYAETILEILDNAADEWRLLFLGRNAAILVHASLIPSLSAELLSPSNRDPARFRDVDNPETLSRLFLLYVNRSSGAAAVIRDIYRRNVSNFYRHKGPQLSAMAEIIAERRSLETSATR